MTTAREYTKAVTEAAWGYADQRLRDLGPAAEES